MKDLEVPTDDEAEEAVVGTAIASSRGCRSATGIVTEAAFYWPLHARLFVAAQALDDIEATFPVCCTKAMTAGTGCPEHPYWPNLSRLRAVAAAVIACCPAQVALDLVEERPLMWDNHGRYAGRVAEAARRRKIMVAAERLFNGIGSGLPLKELDEELDALKAA